MKRLNKVLAALLALVMVLAMLPMTALAADYDDTTGHWAKDQIDRWTDEGVVQGDENGDFNPNDGMTRAAAAKVFADLLKLKGEADLSAFTDVDPTAWYATDGYLAKAVKAGIIKGTGDTTMSPDGTLTREQLFVMMGRALGIKPAETANKQFTDEAKTSDWAEGYINALVNMGVINGTNDGTTMEPKITINRASVMAALDKAIGGYANEDGDTVEIVEGKVTLVVADNVKVEGTADPDLPIVVTGEAGSVDMKGVTGEATVQVQASDVAIKNAPVGTTVEAAEDAADVTVNGTTVPEDGEVTVKPAPKPTPTPTPEPEKQPADYTVIFDATYGKIKADTNKGTLDPTCYGGENDDVANDQKWISIQVNQVKELKLSTYYKDGFPFTVTGPKGNGFAEDGATLAGWFKPDSNSEAGKIAADNAALMDVDLVTLDTDGDHQIVLSAYWNKAGGTDAGVCYGGENDENGTYGKGSEELPAEPQKYTIIFDATDWGTIALKASGEMDSTCWGGENTCWGGDNNDQGNHRWVIFKVDANSTDTLASKGIAPDTFFELTPTQDHNGYKHEGWGYLKSSELANGTTPTAYANQTIAEMAESNTVILVAGWKVDAGTGSTCYGGVNDAVGDYSDGNNTSVFPGNPEP